MSPVDRNKKPWPLILVAAGLLVLSLLAIKMVRLPEPPVPVSKKATPGKGFVLTHTSDDPVRRESEQLLDLDPLFLPTPFNASQLTLPIDAQRERGAAFRSFDAKYVFNADTLTLGMPDAVSVPLRPADGFLVGQTPNPYVGVGRMDREEGRLVDRLAYLEIVQSSTGRVLATDIISKTEAPPPAAIKSGSDWRPLELIVAINAAGRVGQPALVSGSGLDEVDEYFREFLAKSFRLGARLDPGIYVLRVGP